MILKLLKNSDAKLALLIGLPTILLIALGQINISGKYFWVVFAVVFTIKIIKNDVDGIIFVLLSNSPLIMILREYAFFNVIVFIYLILFSFVFIKKKSIFDKLLVNYPFLLPAMLLFIFYYFASFLNTGVYSRNLRALEFLFTIVSVMWLYQNISKFKQFLSIFIFLSILYGLSALRYIGDYGRLGGIEYETTFGATTIGNPIQIGILMSIAIFSLILDKSYWIKEYFSRNMIIALVAISFSLLLLSTSRAGWLFSALGWAVTFLLGSRNRFRMLMYISVLALSFSLLQKTEYFEWAQKGIDRTFGSEKSLVGRTNGRSDQWALAWTVFTENGSNFIMGQGIGNGTDLYKSESAGSSIYGSGKAKAWHSLFMQIIVETGIIGLLIYLWLLFVIVSAIYANFKKDKLILSLIMFLGYIVIIFTTSGFDLLTGILFGIGSAHGIRNRKNPKSFTMAGVSEHNVSSF